ncbi:hypothetical protein IIA79_07945 [bacterium]|nr:hypothetical protein [bacterium]
MQRLLLVSLIFVGGCGLFGGNLSSQAASYYNYMVGRSPDTAYTSFLSPAFRHALSEDTMRQLNNAKGKGLAAGDRYPEAAVEDVFTAVSGSFAYTAINPELGNAYRNLEAVRWVKAGYRWYIYIGSDAERESYGPFPAELIAPVP